MEKKDKIKVIYIVGLGHSGSTLLDRVISTSFKVFSVGELKFLKEYINEYDPRRPERENFKDLSGKRLAESDFWGPIVKEIKEKGYNTYERSAKLSRFDFLKWLFLGGKMSCKFSEMEIFTGILKQAQEIKGEQVEYILDSSKNLKRLLYLKNNNNIDVSVIHLVKDVRGQINSWEKSLKNNKHWFRMFFVWLKQHLVITLVLKLKFSKDKYLRVGYDEFAKTPKKIIKKINSKFNLDVDPEDYINLVNKEKDFAFAGNGMRQRELEEIKHDEKWRENFNKGKKIILSFLAFVPNKVWVYGRK